MIRLTAVIPTQQLKPINIGLPPVLTNFTISVLIPIAAIAQIIKNLLTDLRNPNKESAITYTCEPDANTE